jgi:hypothetical protein
MFEKRMTSYRRPAPIISNSPSLAASQTQLVWDLVLNKTLVRQDCFPNCWNLGTIRKLNFVVKNGDNADIHKLTIIIRVNCF